MSRTPLLQVEALTVTYALPSQRLFRPGRRFAAVDGASLVIERGESLGLVGETGCGKSSLSRAIYGLVPISSGTVRFDGADLTAAAGARRRELGRGMQMIFQDPGASLNPRMRVGTRSPSRSRSTGRARADPAASGCARSWRRSGSARMMRAGMPTSSQAGSVSGSPSPVRW